MIVYTPIWVSSIIIRQCFVAKWKSNCNAGILDSSLWSNQFYMAGLFVVVAFSFFAFGSSLNRPHSECNLNNTIMSYQSVNLNPLGNLSSAIYISRLLNNFILEAFRLLSSALFRICMHVWILAATKCLLSSVFSAAFISDCVWKWFETETFGSLCVFWFIFYRMKKSIFIHFKSWMGCYVQVIFWIFCHCKMHVFWWEHYFSDYYYILAS